MVKHDPIYYLVFNPFDPKDIYWFREFVFSARPYCESGIYITILEQFCVLPEEQMHEILSSASARIQRIMWDVWNRHNERRRNRNKLSIDQESQWHLDILFESEF
nr:ORF2 [Bracoviriform inaniti]